MTNSENLPKVPSDTITNVLLRVAVRARDIRANGRPGESRATGAPPDDDTLAFEPASQTAADRQSRDHRRSERRPSSQVAGPYRATATSA